MRKMWRILGFVVILMFGASIAVSSVQFARADGGSCQASVSYASGATSISVTVSSAAAEGYHVVNVTRPDGSSGEWFGTPAMANGTFGADTHDFQSVGTYSFSINLAGGGGCSASLTISADGTGTGSGGNSGSTYHPTCMIDPDVPMIWSQDGGKFYTEFRIMGPTKDLFWVDFGDGEGFQPYAADNIVRAPHDYNGETDTEYNGQIRVAATGELCKSFTVVVSGGQFSLLVEGDLVSGNAEASVNEPVAVDQTAVSTDANAAQSGDPECVKKAQTLFSEQVSAGVAAANTFQVNPRARCVGVFIGTDGFVWGIDAGKAYPLEVYRLEDSGNPMQVIQMAWTSSYKIAFITPEGHLGLTDRMLGMRWLVQSVSVVSLEVIPVAGRPDLIQFVDSNGKTCTSTQRGEYVNPLNCGETLVYANETDLVAVSPIGEAVKGWSLYQSEDGWYWSTHPELYGEGRYLGICPEATEVRFSQDASKVQYVIKGQQYETDATGKRYAQGCKPLTE